MKKALRLSLAHARGCAAGSVPVLFPGPGEGGAAPPYLLRRFPPGPGRAGRGTSAAKNLASRPGTGMVFGKAAASRGRAVQTVHNSQAAMDNPDAQAMDKLCITVGLLYTAYPQPAHRVTHGRLRWELYTRLHSPGGAPRHPPKTARIYKQKSGSSTAGGGPALVRTWGKAPAQNRRRRPALTRV